MSRLLDKTGAEIDLALDVFPYTPYVSLRRAADYVTVAGDLGAAQGFDSIPWDTEVSDALGWHDTVINPTRITPTIPGRYLVIATATFTQGVDQRGVRVVKNGATVLDQDWIYTNDETPRVVVEVDMNGTTDYITVQASRGGGVGATVKGDGTVIDTYVTSTTKVSMRYIGGPQYQVVRQKPVVWQGTPASMPAGPLNRFDVLELDVTLPSGRHAIHEYVYRDDLDAAYPWHFKGGPSLVAFVDTQETDAGAAGAWQDLPTVLQVVVPRQGYYICETYADTQPGNGGQSTFVGVLANGSTEYHGSSSFDSNGSDGSVTVVHTIGKPRPDRLVPVGGLTVKAQYQASSHAYARYWQYRELGVTPVKIAA